MKLDFFTEQTERKWSPSSLSLILDKCQLQFYYRYFLEIKVPDNPFQALGKFCHTAMHIREKDGKYKGFWMKDRHFYKSAESYGKAMGGRFIRGMRQKGNMVNWEDPSQMFWMKKDIIDIFTAIYVNRGKEDPPKYTEKSFDANFLVAVSGQEKLYRTTGVFDELNISKDGPIIIDHKTDKRKPKKGRKKTDRQFTHYAWGLSTKFLQNHEFASELGISEEDLKKGMEDKFYLLNKINLKFHFMREGELIDVPKRTIESVFDLLIAIDLADKIYREMKKLEPGERPVPIRGPNCEYCAWYEICEKGQVKKEIDLKQFFFQFKGKPKPQIESLVLCDDKGKPLYDL